MDIIKRKILKQKSGSGGIATKLSIPMSWFVELGIEEDEEYVNVELKENEIVITRIKKEPSN